MTRLVIGIQAVREAIRVHRTAIEKVSLVAQPAKDSRPLAGIEKLAHDNGIPIDRLPRATLDRLVHGASHQGVVAVAPELEVQPLAKVLDARPDLLILLDRITDPQNFGAIIRSAVAFGANAIIWPEHDSAPLSPATFRASAGAIEHAALCRVSSLPSAIHTIRNEGVLVVGLAGEGEQAFPDLDLTIPTALVVGAEGSGLRKGVRAACDVLARLPTSPPLDTLNASVSAAVALYETRRQRLATGQTNGSG